MTGKFILSFSAQGAWYGRCLQHRSTPAREPFSHLLFQDIHHCQSIDGWHQVDMPRNLGKSFSPIPVVLCCFHHACCSCTEPSVKKDNLRESLTWLLRHRNFPVQITYTRVKESLQKKVFGKRIGGKADQSLKLFFKTTNHLFLSKNIMKHLIHIYMSFFVRNVECLKKTLFESKILDCLVRPFLGFVLRNSSLFVLPLGLEVSSARSRRKM